MDFENVIFYKAQYLTFHRIKKENLADKARISYWIKKVICYHHFYSTFIYCSAKKNTIKIILKLGIFTEDLKNELTRFISHL